jgi:hypothetical protein
MELINILLSAGVQSLTQAVRWTLLIVSVEVYASFSAGGHLEAAMGAMLLFSQGLNMNSLFKKYAFGFLLAWQSATFLVLAQPWTWDTLFALLLSLAFSSGAYLFMLNVLFPGLRDLAVRYLGLQKGLDISGHTFLITWSFLILRRTLASLLSPRISLDRTRRDQLDIFFVVVGCVYGSFLALIGFGTVFYFHTKAEVFLAILVGSLTFHILQSIAPEPRLPVTWRSPAGPKRGPKKRSVSFAPRTAIFWY